MFQVTKVIGQSVSFGLHYTSYFESWFDFSIAHGFNRLVLLRAGFCTLHPLKAKYIIKHIYIYIKYRNMKAGQLIRSFSRSMLDDSGAGELGTRPQISQLWTQCYEHNTGIQSWYETHRLAW